MTSSAQDINELPAQALRQIDRICTRFEQAWKSGSAPRLEEFWSDGNDPHSGVLLVELLRVEFDCRQRHGQQPSPREYVSRFPDRSGLIAQAWDAHQRSSASGVTRSASLTVQPGMSVDDLADAPLPAVAGYDVQRLIGSGGMAVVYLSRDQRLDRPVALKLISAAHPSPQLVARFRTEAQAIARLQHPNIVQIYEIGEHESRPYLALEYVGGGSLAEWIAGDPRPPQEAAQLVEVLARAIQAAHEQGVVHRDLKPANVLLRKNGNVTPKVSDFGLAKFLDTDVALTQSGIVVGTASYMAPEQASGKTSVGPPADIYALGAILYELITGRPPFKAATVIETARLVRETEPVCPRQLQPQTPRDLETVCLKCLEKDPKRRYSTALDLADDLRRFLNGQPLHARPVGSLARAWRWSRRNQAVAALAAAVAVAMLIGSVVSTYFALQASRRARDNQRLALEAEAKRKQAETVSKYLISAFRSPDPSRNGRGVTIAEVLDRAVKELDVDFPDQPLVKAEIARAMGLTYLGLGLPDQAVGVLETSSALIRSQAGEDDVRFLLVSRDLAAAYRRAGDTTRSIALAQTALERLRAALGDDDPETLAAMRSLAHAFEDAGDWSRSAPLHERVLEVMRRTSTPGSLDTLVATANVAGAYLYTGQLGRGIRMLEEALETARSNLPRNHPQTIAIMDSLAVAYNLANQRDRAIAILEQSLPLSREALGEDHPDRLRAMGSLAQMYRQAGRAKEAIPLVERVLRVQRATLGDDHPDTMNTLSRLAITFDAAGDSQQALRYHQEAFDHRREKLGPEHPHTLISMAFLSSICRRTGDLPRAVLIMRECLEIHQRNSPGSPSTFYAQAVLGRTLIEMKEYAEAELHLLRGYEGLRAAGDQFSPWERRDRLLFAPQYLIELYEKWDKPAEAQKWREVMALILQQTPAPSSAPLTQPATMPQ